VVLPVLLRFWRVVTMTYMAGLRSHSAPAFTVPRLSVQRSGRLGGPAAIALSSSRTTLLERTPVFLADIEIQMRRKPCMFHRRVYVGWRFAQPTLPVTVAIAASTNCRDRHQWSSIDAWATTVSAARRGS